MMACKENNKCVKLLLDKGADVHLQDVVSAVSSQSLFCLVHICSLYRKGIHVVEVACVENSTLSVLR